MKKKNSTEMRLVFVGRDPWSRPVYEDEAGKLWKDTTPESRWVMSLCTSYGNAFGGEPDIPMRYMTGYQDVEITLFPRRDCWDDPVRPEEMEKWCCIKRPEQSQAAPGYPKKDGRNMYVSEE